MMYPGWGLRMVEGGRKQHNAMAMGFVHSIDAAPSPWRSAQGPRWPSGKARPRTVPANRSGLPGLLAIPAERRCRRTHGDTSRHPKRCVRALWRVAQPFHATNGRKPGRLLYSPRAARSPDRSRRGTNPARYFRHALRCRPDSIHRSNRLRRSRAGRESPAARPDQAHADSAQRANLFRRRQRERKRALLLCSGPSRRGSPTRNGTS